MKIDHISASGIETFDQCPQKFYAIYVLKIPKAEPHPLTLMGSATHMMLEKAVIARIFEGSQMSGDPMAYRQQAQEAFKVSDENMALADELIANALRWGYFRNVNRTVGCEMEISFKSLDGTPVVGKIDRLDVSAPTADIIDIKTQKAEFTDKELQDKWQKKIYNIGARIIRPEITGEASVSFWVLRHQVQRAFLSAKDAEKDMVGLQEKIDEIKACPDDPQGNPSALCRWCPREKDCVWKDASFSDRLKGMRR